MSRISLIDPAVAVPPASMLLERTRRQLGAVPNIFRAMANSPALLAGYLDLAATLAGGELDSGDQERVAVAVAESNDGSYRLAAHCFLAERAAHLPASEIADARRPHSADPRSAAVLTNLFNKTAQVDVDFPAVAALPAIAA